MALSIENQYRKPFGTTRLPLWQVSRLGLMQGAFGKDALSALHK
jgi:hypothetical protein